MNARSWFLVGARLLGLYLLIGAVSEMPAALAHPSFLQRLSQEPFKMETLITKAVLSVMLIAFSPRLADLMGFKEKAPHSAEVTEEGFLRGAFSLLGLWWAITSGLSLGAMVLSSVFVSWRGSYGFPFLHFVAGMLLFLNARRLARWAVKVRR